jgi:hypothetical protein
MASQKGPLPSTDKVCGCDFLFFDSSHFHLQICDLHQQIDDGKLKKKRTTVVEVRISSELVSVIRSARLLIFFFVFTKYIDLDFVHY